MKDRAFFMPMPTSLREAQRVQLVPTFAGIVEDRGGDRRRRSSPVV